MKPAVGAGLSFCSHSASRSLEKDTNPQNTHHNSIVLARVHGKTLVRRMVINGKTGQLVADNPDYPAIELKQGFDYRILGLVRYRIGEL